MTSSQKRQTPFQTFNNKVDKSILAKVIFLLYVMILVE